MTEAEFDLLSDVLPPPKSGDRPRSVNLWEVINAIFYVLTTSCQGRALLSNFPAWQTVHTYFRNWRKDGTWLTIHDELYRCERMAQG